MPGRWQLHTALRASTLALTASLVVIGYLAARRLNLSLPTSQRLVVLFAEFGLGVLVIAIELLAHRN